MLNEILSCLIMFQIFFLGAGLSLALHYNTWFYFTPKYIYKNSKLNMFGCICISLFYLCIFTLYVIIVSGIWLLWKLSHTGRKH